MICFVLLCVLIQFSQSQPLLNGYADDERAQIYDQLLTNYLVGSNRAWKSNLPESIFDYQQQQQQRTEAYNPDTVQLSKRIIMLPRVGRRSVRSMSQN